MKLAIVGSRAFTNKNKVKLLIEKYIDFYGIDDLEIVSGGCPDGADAIGKELALEMGVKYIEFPPKHRPHNCYCVKSSQNYGQPYHVSNYFVRNTEVAEYCDHLAAFVVYGVTCNGTMDTFVKAKKFNKKCFFFEDNIDF